MQGNTVTLEVLASAPTAPHPRSGDHGDRVLAARAGRGDEQAFADLYDRHAAGLLAFASQYVGDRAAAEDVVQQTFLAAYRVLSAGTELEHPRAWLYHVARNNSLTTIRDRGPAGVDAELAAELQDRAAAVPVQVERREALQSVVRDIVALPAEQRAALALYELGDLSQAEIADTLGCKPARVKALVFQARTSLVTQRDARDASCDTVREKLATVHGGALNQRLIRHHLRGCERCTAYRDELRDQRRRVALLLPVLPLPGLREAVLGVFGGGAAASATAGGSGGAGGVLSPGRSRWLATGAATTVAVAGVTMAAWPSAETPRKLPSRASAAAAPSIAPAIAPAPAPQARAQAPARRESAPARLRSAGGGARVKLHLVRSTTPASDGPASTKRDQAAPVPRPAPDRARKVTPRSPPAEQAPTGTPKPKPAPAPGPAPAPAAQSEPAPADPPVPVPETPVTPVPPATPAPEVCTDHSHASEQGLAHGKGHHKCKGP